MLITNFHVSASHPLIRLLVCAVTAAVVLYSQYHLLASTEAINQLAIFLFLVLMPIATYLLYQASFSKGGVFLSIASGLLLFGDIFYLFLVAVLFAGYAMIELLSEKAEELQVTEIIFLGDIKNEKNKN